MDERFDIRETIAEDFAKVLSLYPLAFPDEELRPVVSALMEGEYDVLSMAAFESDELVAHVLFTRFDQPQQGQRCALLAPLGVIPSHQKKGLGSLIVRAGLEQLTELSVGAVFVLGDPTYYQRFGFEPDRQVLPPYPIPQEYADAWQSMLLTKPFALEAGPIALPEPWLDPALWAA